MVFPAIINALLLERVEEALAPPSGASSFLMLSGASTCRETDGRFHYLPYGMVRLTLACALAVALILAGGAIEYDAFATNSPLKFSVALIAMGLGIAWLYSTVREWRFR
jgi:predicted outer membrane lipoprotein